MLVPEDAPLLVPAGDVGTCDDGFAPAAGSDGLPTDGAGWRLALLLGSAALPPVDCANAVPAPSAKMADVRSAVFLFNMIFFPPSIGWRRNAMTYEQFLDFCEVFWVCTQRRQSVAHGLRLSSSEKRRSQRPVTMVGSAPGV